MINCFDVSSGLWFKVFSNRLSGWAVWIKVFFRITKLSPDDRR